ncbi:MAG: hypothetical protein ACFBQW_01600 [Sphingomonadaceae bacterium]
MPQFDPDAIVPQLVWLTLFFAILYAIVLATLPRLGRVMEARESRVGGDIEAAETAKQDAERIRSEYEAALEEARAKGRQAIARSREEAARTTEAKLAALGEELDAKMNEAEARIEQSRRKALAEIERIAASASAEIVARLTGRRPPEPEAKSAARAALEA